MKRSSTATFAAALAAFAFAFAFAEAETVKVIDCVRDASLDFWAAQDSEFCHKVMQEVFREAGYETEHVPFGDDHLMVSTNAEVICSVFRNPDILENYEFPVQPIGRMHFALYTTPDRAPSMMSTKITDWPRMRVGYSPVSQGQNQDRQNYFNHARLSPDYVEIPTSAGAVEALKEGDLDALFLYTPIGRRPEGLTEIVPIGERNVYFAVRRDKPELLAKLSAAYRECYIDQIDQIDAWRLELLGIPKPKKRVRLAAYERGDFFNVSPAGDHSGALEKWMKAICGRTRWTLDYVYGDFDQSVADVKSGRLDIVAGLGFASRRREEFFFPHTPIGMLRVYLWAHPGSPYKPGNPETWAGMKVGMLAGTVSAERAKRQFDRSPSLGISYRDYHSDKAMLEAYLSGEVDACIDTEQPELTRECALHVYASYPMYVCTALGREALSEELEMALEEICDDFPKYLRMISERHYGLRSEMAALSLNENEWLSGRAKTGEPIYVDFSPWPFPLFDKNGKPDGFIGALLSEISRKTGLKFLPQEQTDLKTAEAKFLRGETDFWVPYPARSDSSYGAESVFSLPVPQSIATLVGAEDIFDEFQLFARSGVPDELKAIINKVVTGIDPTHLQEMFMADYAERHVVHRVFGLTDKELKHLLAKIIAALAILVAAYGLVMMLLLRKQARRATAAAALAEEHAQAKTRFLAMMSHELRTPLNAVIGFAEFLAREGVEESKRREYIDGILLSSNALLELINDILDFSKLEAGAMDMRSGLCDVNQLLRELPAIFGYRVRRHGVKLAIEAPEKAIPVLKLSHQGLRQILINIVGNSAKFTEQGEIRVVVHWDETTSSLHLEVRDTGCGISEDKMAKLFNPFVQDIGSRMKSSAGEIKGTGLGLPIVKRMVENAGGTISAKSKLGEGTTFFIDIPNIGIAEAQPPAPTTAAAVLSQAIPERVLVVDDMTMNRKILGIHLDHLGVKDIRYAENGKKALEVMDEWLPDAVLTDMWMPIMDGTQLAEAMHRERRLMQIPIVAVTADIDVGSTYDMSLFTKVIAKPVSGDKLKHLFGEI